MAKWIIIGISSAIIVALLILFLGTTTVPYQVQEPYEVTKEIQEPYQVQVDEKLTYEVIDVEAFYERTLSLPPGNLIIEGTVEILNTDNVGGGFKVKFWFRKGNHTITDSDSVYILAGETKTLSGSAEIGYWGDIDSWNYEVIPDTKMVSETHYRTKTVTETEWRTVTRYRQVSLIEAIFE